MKPWLARLGSATLLALVALVVPVAPVVSAEAQEGSVPMRSVQAALVDGVPQLGFDARSFADGSVRDKLKSGLPQTIVLRVMLQPPGRKQPVAFSAQSCRVLYDLWGGSYRIQLDRPGRSLELSVGSIQQVVDRCLHIHELPISGLDLPRYRGQRLYFSVDVELNPLSQATVQRIRRWLSRPAGGQLGGDAFIGSFVSIFVGREIGSAEKSVTYRSRAWTVPR